MYVGAFIMVRIFVMIIVLIGATKVLLMFNFLLA